MRVHSVSLALVKEISIDLLLDHPSMHIFANQDAISSASRDDTTPLTCLLRTHLFNELLLGSTLQWSIHRDIYLKEQEQLLTSH